MRGHPVLCGPTERLLDLTYSRRPLREDQEPLQGRPLTAASKIRVLVLFGGRSAEHEISILSARFIVSSLDRSRFEPILIGIMGAIVGGIVLAIFLPILKLQKSLAGGKG